MPERSALATRWLGVGLASVISVITISLWATGRLGLYINPDSAWFAVGMAMVLLVGTIASFALPLGAEADHGHDHGDAPQGAHAHGHGTDGHDAAGHDAEPHFAPGAAEPHVHFRPSPIVAAATLTGGVAASALVVAALVLPPASLSAELAMSRDVGAPPLFAGSDAVTLAATGDTASFGIGEWSAVFATATNPDAFDGDPVTLTGFVTPGDDGFALTRLVITHCVIDAQTATVPVSTASVPDTGQWVTVTGSVRAGSDGSLQIVADQVEAIAEPQDPYEY